MPGSRQEDLWIQCAQTCPQIFSQLLQACVGAARHDEVRWVYVARARKPGKAYATCNGLPPYRIKEKMHLEIKQREHEGIPILDLKGRVVLGDEDSSLRQTLESMYDAGSRNVILNMHDVSQLDSAGLGTMVLIATKLRDAGGKLALLKMSPSHAKLPEILKLSTLFETYQDEVDAVNSFFPDRKVPHYDILQFVEQLEHEHDAESKISEKKEKG